MYGGELIEEVRVKLIEYKKKSKEGSPLLVFGGTTSDLIKELEECIKNNKKYDTSFWDENPGYKS